MTSPTQTADALCKQENKLKLLSIIILKLLEMERDLNVLSHSSLPYLLQLQASLIQNLTVLCGKSLDA